MEFQNQRSAATAEEAFGAPVDEALHEDGHAGYTGAIAEKDCFRMEMPRAGESPFECAARCSADPSDWSSDKWGPAVCVDGGPDPAWAGGRMFYFFGWASS